MLSVLLEFTVQNGSISAGPVRNIMPGVNRSKHLLKGEAPGLSDPCGDIGLR